MERTVPSTASEEIELYLRTVYSLLRSSTEVPLRALEEVHAGMNSALHPHARQEAPDTSAFIYSLLRLPECMPRICSVVLGQSAEVFAQHGYRNIETWEMVAARARRRRCYYDSHCTLACFIASRTDIEDVLPTLTAYQIEWNKLHALFKLYPRVDTLEEILDDLGAFRELADALQMSVDDLDRLRSIWRDGFIDNLREIASRTCSIAIRLLSGSLSEYWRATRAWWDNIERHFPGMDNRPTYFISSNTHSIANLLSGFALRQQEVLIEYLKRSDNRDLLNEWRDIQEIGDPTRPSNFLYYLLKKFQQTPEGKHSAELQLEWERTHGIHRVPSEHFFDVDAQVIELCKLDPAALDPRLNNLNLEALAASDAIIINIDYPLGLGAYNILAKVAEHISPVLGVYVMGKAATLNGVRGDVMIPSVVHDEHSQNTYLFQNAFTAADVVGYLGASSVMDNQKAVSVLGTFLQNARVMDVMYREGYTDIEMEAGPFLSAIYEMYRPKRHPVNEIVNLYGAGFDIGILHYASDTPLSKGKNLGAGALSYLGMEPTYATSIAILRRILSRERQRLM